MSNLISHSFWKVQSFYTAEQSTSPYLIIIKHSFFSFFSYKGQQSKLTFSSNLNFSKLNPSYYWHGTCYHAQEIFFSTQNRKILSFLICLDPSSSIFFLFQKKTKKSLVIFKTIFFVSLWCNVLFKCKNVTNLSLLIIINHV